MGKIRYFHVVEAFGGGVLHSVSQLCHALGSKDFSWTVVHSFRKETPPNYMHLFPQGVRLIPLPMRREIHPWHDLKAFFYLFHLLWKEQPHIVHLHSSKAGFLGRMVCSLLNLPVLYSPRGFSFFRQDVSPWKRRFFFLLEKIASSTKSVIVALSREEFLWARRLSPYVVWIPNGVDLSFFDALSPALSSEIPLVGTSGRILPQKNPSLFARIARFFHGQAKFLWIGDGEDRVVFQKTPVEVTGWKDRRESLSYVASLDIYLQTSLWEGMPLSVLEAMALGKPVVAMKVVGNEDLVLHGKTGFLATSFSEFVEYISWLLESPERRKKMGEAAREWVKKHYTMEKIACRYRELIFELLRRRSLWDLCQSLGTYPNRPVM